MRSKPILYAHRGAAIERPENTIVAFARALELGADALETDAHLSADGQVVLSHDPDGRRMAQVHRAISDSTLGEIRGWDVARGFVDSRGARPFKDLPMPTLEQLLSEFPGVAVNVDLKRHAPVMVEAVVSLLRRRGDEERVTLASFDARTIRAVRSRGYAGRTCLSQVEVIELMTLPRAMLRRLPWRGTRAQIPPRVGPLTLATGSMIERCHAVDVPVDFWTIDDPAEARRLLALGADGIMTNDPKAIAPLFRALT